MLASVLIIAFSLVLLIYWFRASCQLLLRNRAEELVSTGDLDTRFCYQQVQARLNTSQQLGELQGLLNRDFQVLTYLRQHAADLESGSFEDQLLILDYRLMGWYCRVMNKVAPAQARSALSEMARVVGLLACKMGPQTPNL